MKCSATVYVVTESCAAKSGTITLIHSAEISLLRSGNVITGLTHSDLIHSTQTTTIVTIGMDFVDWSNIALCAVSRGDIALDKGDTKLANRETITAVALFHGKQLKRTNYRSV